MPKDSPSKLAIKAKKNPQAFAAARKKFEGKGAFGGIFKRMFSQVDAEIKGMGGPQGGPIDSQGRSRSGGSFSTSPAVSRGIMVDQVTPVNSKRRGR